MASNVAYNVDCMDYLKTVPDKYFDLAVVDPPYGLGITGKNGGGVAASEITDPFEGKTQLYGHWNRALSKRTFILCLTTAPRQTRNISGSYFACRSTASSGAAISF